MKPELTEDDVIELMFDKIVQLGSRTAFAAHVGVSRAYLFDLVTGRKSVPQKGAVLDALGLECKVRWTRR